MPGTPADETRRAVADVLAGDEYAELRPTLLDRLWDAVLDLLGRLIDLVGQTGQGGLVGTILLVGMLVAVGVVAARFLGRVQRDAVAGGAPVEVGGRSAAEWVAEAHAHELAGRWRDAVRCHYRALVAELAAAGLVEELPGRTAGEYRAQVAASVPAAADAMADATRRFEVAWYAHEPIGADAVHGLLEAVTSVSDAATLRTRAVPS